MSDSPREIARTLKSSYAVLDDVPLDEIADQVRALREAGIEDEELKTLVPKMFELKTTVENHLADETPLAPKEIRINSLPDRYQREDWS